jgi:hypothetical protein
MQKATHISFSACAARSLQLTSLFLSSFFQVQGRLHLGWTVFFFFFFFFFLPSFTCFSSFPSIPIFVIDHEEDEGLSNWIRTSAAQPKWRNPKTSKMTSLLICMASSAQALPLLHYWFLLSSYEDNDAPKPAPAQAAPAPAPVPESKAPESHEVAPSVAAPEAAGDDQMEQEYEDDDDDVDFNLGGPTTTTHNQTQNQTQNQVAPYEEAPQTPPYGTVHKASAKDDG